MDAYEQAVNQTASKAAPWYVIPADKKWYARLLVSDVIVETLEKLNPAYPEVGDAQKQALEACRAKFLEDKES